MANAYSEQIQYNNYIPPRNLELINAVLGSKEQKYNANMAKIDAVIETYAKSDLYRPEDRAVLYENINNVINQFKGVSKMALSNTDNVRLIEQSFQQSITPYLAEQMANTAKIRKTFNEASKLKEKHPEKYSDVNMSYLLKEMGIEDYANKKTDKINSATLTEYVNEHEELTKGMSEYAKNFGYDSYQKLVQDASNPEGYFTNIKGESFSADKVKNYLNSVISSNPKLQKQMEINAWAKYGGMSDADFAEEFKTANKEKANQYGEVISKYETLRNQYVKGSTEYEEIEAQIKENQTKQEYFNNVSNSDVTKNRDMVAMTVYSQDVINRLADTYSYNRITDTDYLDIPMKQAEFKRKLEKHKWERNEKLGLNPDGTATGIESSYTLPDENTTESKTVYEKQFSAYSTERQALRTELQKDSDFASKSTVEQEAVIDALIKSDVSNTTILDANSGIINRQTPEVKNMVNSIRQNRSYLVEYANLSVKEYTNQTKEFYDSLVNRGNSSVDLNSLASTIPTLVSLVKKGKSFDNLNENEKNKVLYEYTKNIESIYGQGDSQEKNRAFVASESFARRLEKDDSNKGWLNKSKNTSESSSSGFWNWAYDNVTGDAMQFAGNIGKSLNETRILTQKRFASSEREKELDKELKESFSGNKGFGIDSIKEGEKRSSRSDQYLSGIFKADEDLASLSRNDVMIGASKENHDSFQKSRKVMRDDSFKKLDEEYGTNVPTTKQISFSKELKQNVPYVNDIKAVVEASTGKKVDDSSTYSMRFNTRTGNYEFDVVTTEKVLTDEKKQTYKDIPTKETVPVPPQMVTQRLRQRLSPSALDFSQSAVNKNRRPEVVKMTIPNTPKAKDLFIEKYTQGYGLDQNAMNKLEELIKTPTERFNELPYSYTEEQRVKLANIYSAQPEVSFKGSYEEGYVATVVATDSNGKEIYREKFPPIKGEFLYNQSDKELLSIDYINSSIKLQEQKTLLK